MKTIPTYSGTLRSHLLTIPSVISQCSGIRVFGRRIKSLVFTTDVAIIKNVNADAIIAVYPFTPQPAITQAIINVSDVPVFVGVGGGMTNGDRSVRLAQDAENQGAYGVVVNAPITTETISKMKALVDIPVITTIVSSGMDVAARVKAGADILNVSGASRTPEIVAQLRREFPDMAIIATGGPTEEDIIRTIEAGANAITYTPPTTGELFVPIMREHRKNFAAEKL
ncbi:MAG: hydrolase [Oscillospiraceae bacterium]|nr:hydrolase [Oscillospiraceae bacterium]MCI9394848.1 hydrolase [Oscillospiraceae bacterium]MCI9581823.1 hydrolase [Oscillospiraceae bacterium]